MYCFGLYDKIVGKHDYVIKFQIVNIMSEALHSIRCSKGRRLLLLCRVITMHLHNKSKRRPFRDAREHEEQRCLHQLSIRYVLFVWGCNNEDNAAVHFLGHDCDDCDDVDRIHRFSAGPSADNPKALFTIMY